MPIYLRPHNDEPVSALDSLPERKSLVEHIVDAVAECEPPQVMGVHGEWGTGKTSFLCAIERQLQGCCRRLDPKATPNPPKRFQHVAVVWFEAWRYQYEPSSVIALLHEICAQLPFGKTTMTELRKLAFAGFQGLINTIKEVTIDPKVLGTSLGSVKLNSPVQSITEAGEKFERDHFLAPLTTEQIRHALDQAITALLDGANKKKRARVVVIIDDLDRCEPAAAYRLLEGIKIYLNIPSCVFLLGINQKHINQALGDSLGIKDKDQAGEAEKRGAEYLEKLCSVIWRLPVSKPSSVTLLLRQWLSPRIDGGKLLDTYPLPAALISLVGKLGDAFDCLPRNPRKLKAFCNTFRHLVAQTASTPAQPGDELGVDINNADALIVAASIYTFHPELLIHLQASPLFFEILLQFSSEGITVVAPNSSTDWIKQHEAFKSLQLPWDKAKDQEAGYRHPGPDGGRVFRIQALLNHAVGAKKSDDAPSEYKASFTRGAFYNRLKPYLFL